MTSPFLLKTEKKRFFFMAYVQTPYKAIEWFKMKINKEITHINVYDRRSRKYLGTLKNLNI